MLARFQDVGACQCNDIGQAVAPHLGTKSTSDRIVARTGYSLDHTSVGTRLEEFLAPLAAPLEALCLQFSSEQI